MACPRRSRAGEVREGRSPPITAEGWNTEAQPTYDNPSPVFGEMLAVGFLLALVRRRVGKVPAQLS